ncbi:hypothetical protein ACHWQZ_G002780 [Mnemiopsis leidyi]
MKAEINEPPKTKPTIPKRVSLSTSHNSAKGTAGSKSAGNTPSSSPLVSKDVLTSKNVQKRRNLKEELNIDDEEVINVDGLDEVTASEGGLSTSKGQCPCFNTGSKNALLIKCVKCTQAFHPTCVNLNGLTKASMNKLTTWKCPDCFIFPYSQQSEKRSEAEAFSDFLKIFPRISQCNEELKESASTVEFFNEHIKHLVINEDSYKVQSQKLNHMETEIKLIKQGMDRLSKLSQEKNELEIPKLEILKQMQVQLQDFIRSNDNKDSKELSECSAGAITFRHVAPFFKNSTVIVGDSNTKYIKFGKDAGTLGKWLPGKRMWAAKIGDIPSPKDIGPYRNIVIHSGINDIRDDFNRASNRALIGQLKRKCDDIQKFYPNAKLHLSLLLPTKSPHVNVRVRELNSLFIDFVFNRNNMFVIDNSVLGTQNGCMPSKYGRFLRNGTPLAYDVVHLGREGLRLFCMNIKRCIVQRGERQSVERFRGRSGDYRDALIRGVEVLSFIDHDFYKF